MMLTINPVMNAIEAHRLAVQADEASFDAGGNVICSTAADATYEAEQEAFRLFVRTPCRTPEDITAKLTYIFNGSVGDRDTLLDCLTICEYAGDNGWKDLLNSFRLGQERQA